MLNVKLGGNRSKPEGKIRRKNEFVVLLDEALRDGLGVYAQLSENRIGGKKLDVIVVAHLLPHLSENLFAERIHSFADFDFDSDLFPSCQQEGLDADENGLAEFFVRGVDHRSSI